MLSSDAALHTLTVSSYAELTLQHVLSLFDRCRYLSEGSAACLLGLATALFLLAFRRHVLSGVITALLQFDSANFFM